MVKRMSTKPKKLNPDQTPTADELWFYVGILANAASWLDRNEAKKIPVEEIDPVATGHLTAARDALSQLWTLIGTVYHQILIRDVYEYYLVAFKQLGNLMDDDFASKPRLEAAKDIVYRAENSVTPFHRDVVRRLGKENILPFKKVLPTERRRRQSNGPTDAASIAVGEIFGVTARTVLDICSDLKQKRAAKSQEWKFVSNPFDKVILIQQVLENTFDVPRSIAYETAKASRSHFKEKPAKRLSSGRKNRTRQETESERKRN